MKIADLLQKMVSRNASDLHLKTGSPPGMRLHGDLVPIEGCEILDAAGCGALINELLTEPLRETFEKKRDLDFSKHIEGLARFRINLFHQRGAPAAVLRLIPIKTPVLEEMNFPDIVRQLCQKPRGLVLVTGPTGSGKSTTLAAMVDYINRSEPGHILTLEDPIEFLHKDKKCFVNQREIGSDSLNFTNALRAALREDPDYILVGELRDLETISLAITAAETGHLVFGTLHTTSATQTIDRIIDVFPHDAQQQVRTQLSMTLQGVISQTLLPKIGGGRACAQEIMIGTDAVRNLIREGKTPQLINILQTSAQHGMQTLESHLSKLVMEWKVTPDDAVAVANNPLSLSQSLEKCGKSLSRPDAPQKAGPAAGIAAPAAPSQRPTIATTLKIASSGSPPAPAAEKPRDPAAPSSARDEFEQFRTQRKQLA